MNGKVKFFNKMKGFGFITGEDGKDYFVHYTALKEGTTLQENDSVTFEAVQGDRGMKAENVNVVSGGESESFGEQSEEDTQEEPEEQSEDDENESEEESKE